MKTTGLFSILTLISFAGLKYIFSYTSKSFEKIESLWIRNIGSYAQKEIFRIKKPTEEKIKATDHIQQVIRKRMRNLPPRVQHRVGTLYDKIISDFFS